DSVNYCMPLFHLPTFPVKRPDGTEMQGDRNYLRTYRLKTLRIKVEYMVWVAVTDPCNPGKLIPIRECKASVTMNVDRTQQGNPAAYDWKLSVGTVVLDDDNVPVTDCEKMYVINVPPGPSDRIYNKESSSQQTGETHKDANGSDKK